MSFNSIEDKELTDWITRVLFAPPDFRIDDYPAGAQPILYNKREGVVLPVGAFLAHRRRDGASELTVRQEAYWLAEYWDYLWLNKINYWQISRRELVRFFDHGGKRDSNIITYKSGNISDVYTETLKAKRDVIYNFYHALQERVGIISGVLRPRHDTGDQTYRLSNRRIETGIGVLPFRGETDLDRGERRREKQRRKRGRPTPSKAASDALFDSILSQDRDEWVATYYQAAKLMRYAGCRGGGCEDLSCEPMRAAILGEYELARELEWLPRLGSLAGAGFDKEAKRTKIIKALQSFLIGGRKYIFISIVEKNGKNRTIMVGVNHFIELLDYIWTTRAEIINRKQKIRAEYEPSDNVFISKKTGRAILSATFGREIRRIFKLNFIPGSPHRLRAAYAEDVVRELYLKQKADNPEAVDFLIILETAAEILGHSNRKTIKKYINNIYKQENIFKGEAIVIEKSSDAEMLRGIAQALDLNDTRSEELRCELRSVMVRCRILGIAPSYRREASPAFNPGLGTPL